MKFLIIILPVISLVKRFIHHIYYGPKDLIKRNSDKDWAVDKNHVTKMYPPYQPM